MGREPPNQSIMRPEKHDRKRQGKRKRAFQETHHDEFQNWVLNNRLQPMCKWMNFKIECSRASYRKYSPQKMHQNESLNLLTGKEEPPLEISTITAFLYVWIYIYTEVLLGSLIVCKWSGQLKNVKIDNMMISIPSFRNILKITRKNSPVPDVCHIDRDHPQSDTAICLASQESDIL